MRQILWVLFFSPFIFSTSCKTIKTDKPATETLPKPVRRNVVNQIVVPIEINLNNYFKQADQKIPKITKGADNPCAGVRYAFEFTKDSFDITTKNNQLLSELYGSYWIKMNYCAGCTSLFGAPTCLTPVVPFSCGIGEKKPSVKIGLTTQIGVDKTYKVESKTIISELKPINPCEVTVFHFDATGEVMKEVRKTIDRQSKELDKQLEMISFEKDAKNVWNNLFQSLPIPYLGYLHLEPKKISLTKPEFSKKKLKTTLILDCATSINQDQTSKPATPLPPLTIAQKNQTDTFEVVTDIQLNCDSLSALLTNQVKGQKVETAGKTFVFEKVSMEGMPQNKLLLSLNFSGSKTGILYLLGTPTFDNITKTFSIQDLSYELETKSSLLKTAKWLFDKRIYNELSKASTLNFSKEFDMIKKQIEKSLYQNFGDYELRGKAHDIDIAEISVSNNELFLQTVIQSQLKIGDKSK